MTSSIPGRGSSGDDTTAPAENRSSVPMSISFATKFSSMI
jgi:hypothetical protein